MKLIKMTLSLLLALGFTNICAAQTKKTFQIISKGKATNIREYKIAIKKANMEHYRYRSHPDTLSFDNGLKFVLFSAQTLKEKGQTIDLYNYTNPEDKVYSTKYYTNPTFHLTPKGTLIALYQPWYKNKKLYQNK